jgi:hypothetical protein
VVEVRVFHYNCWCYSATRFYLSTPRGEEHSEETSKHDICSCPDGIDELCAIQQRQRVDESQHRKRNSRFGTRQHRSEHHNNNHKDQEAQKASQQEGHIHRHQFDWNHQYDARHHPEINSGFNKTRAFRFGRLLFFGAKNENLTRTNRDTPNRVRLNPRIPETPLYPPVFCPRHTRAIRVRS